MRQGRYGSFLVRPSHTNPGDFALSVRYARESVDSILRFLGLTFVTVEYDGSGVQCRSKPWEILEVTSLPPLLPPRPLLSNFSTNRRRHGVGHIRIQNAGDYCDLYGGKMFSTLDELVDYYRQHRRALSKATGVTDMELRNPLSCEEPRWACIAL